MIKLTFTWQWINIIIFRLFKIYFSDFFITIFIIYSENMSVLSYFLKFLFFTLFIDLLEMCTEFLAAMLLLYFVSQAKADGL